MSVKGVVTTHVSLGSDVYSAGRTPVWGLILMTGISAAALTIALSVMHTAFLDLSGRELGGATGLLEVLVLRPGVVDDFSLAPHEILLGAVLTAAGAPSAAAVPVMNAAGRVISDHCRAGCRPIQAVWGFLLVAAMHVAATSVLASWLMLSFIPLVAPESLLTPYAASVVVVPAVLTVLGAAPGLRLVISFRGT